MMSVCSEFILAVFRLTPVRYFVPHLRPQGTRGKAGKEEDIELPWSRRLYNGDIAWPSTDLVNNNNLTPGAPLKGEKTA